MTLLRAAPPTDAAVIAASLASPAAFSGVFERHHAAVHRYLARRLGVDLADELAAETFAIAFAKRGRYDGTYVDARPWLFGIATKLAHRHHRREERELRAYARTGVDAAVPSPAERISERADSAVAARALAAALAALSAGERDVLLLYAWVELDQPEIAVALKIPPGTVKSRLQPDRVDDRRRGQGGRLHRDGPRGSRGMDRGGRHAPVDHPPGRAAAVPYGP